jgi:hypothetical protein
MPFFQGFEKFEYIEGEMDGNYLWSVQKMLAVGAATLWTYGQTNIQH